MIILLYLCAQIWNFQKMTMIGSIIALMKVMPSTNWSCIVCQYSLKKPYRTSHHSGHSFVLEVLNGYKDRYHQQFKMKKHVFMKSCQVLSESYGLKRGTNISIIKLIAIFLLH